MKKLFTAACLFFVIILAMGLAKPAETFKEVSSKLPVGMYKVVWPDTAVSMNNEFPETFPKLSIENELAFQKADANKDKKVSYAEFISATDQQLFLVSLQRQMAVNYLLYLDNNANGYLDGDETACFKKELTTLTEAMNHEKYAYECGQLAYDAKKRIRATGACRKDSVLSISELANAFDRKKIWIGNSLYWKQ